jgi:single-stranded-DNA-specific exonuclease
LGGSDRHLAVKLTQHQVTLRAVGFGRGEWLEELSRIDGPIDVAYRPVINDYRGQRSVEMHLVDWRASQRPAMAIGSR